MWKPWPLTFCEFYVEGWVLDEIVIDNEMPVTVLEELFVSRSKRQNKRKEQFKSLRGLFILVYTIRPPFLI